jgi:hypothetical protein
MRGPPLFEAVSDFVCSVAIMVRSAATRLLWLGLLVAVAMLVPPRPNAGACKAGPSEQAPTGLEADASGPSAPKIISVVRVRPASQVGCQCRPECVDAVKIEYTLETTAQRIYITAANKAFYVQRAEDTPDDAARFYLGPGEFPGGAPRRFSIATVDEAGNLSQSAEAVYDEDQEAEIR